MNDIGGMMIEQRRALFFVPSPSFLASTLFSGPNLWSVSYLNACKCIAFDGLLPSDSEMLSLTKVLHR